MQQCLTCVHAALRTCFFRGEKASNISLRFGQLLLSRQIILDDISAKWVNQRQGSLFPLRLAIVKSLLN